MAAKLLHSLADDNPDLQKQIGCMTGIFQLFDRQSALTGRRLSHRRLPPGDSHGSSERQYFNSYQRPSAAEMNSNKISNEKQRISTESSRTSFSSSCSSMSSLDGYRATQPESSSYDRIIFPETPSRDAVLSHPHLGRQSLDLRDLVKDSMYREARGLTVKTAGKEEPLGHKDSPRPFQHPKSTDGDDKKGKQSASDMRESLRVLAKLREAPWYYNEPRERLSKDGAARFSYDGRETNRLSFESRDTIKSAMKLKELPRLSLDSREKSMWDVSSNSNSNASEQQSLGTHKRPPSVVAKLMGLEAMPDSASVEKGDSFSTSLRSSDVNRPIRVPKSPRSSSKEPVSPRWKNPDLTMKPISRLPIEPAPWKQAEGARASKKPVKVSAKTTSPFPTVYSEIEKRLKDLEFNQSGKDLRALKQILEAMQSKGLLETRREEQGSNRNDAEPSCISPGQKPRALSQQRSHGGNYDSPIVIMKPAKLVEKSGLASSSVVPIDGLNLIGHKDNRSRSPNQRSARDQTPRISHNHRDSKPNIRNRSTQSSTRPQQTQKESTTNSVKSSGSVSPRLQQKKLELERKSRPPTPPSDSTKQRRQYNRMSSESSSPGGKNRPKSQKMQQNDDQLSQISNESRTSSHQGDELKTDVEVSSVEPSPSLKKPSCRLEEDGTLAEIALDTPEHPSPVSVLDASVYRDDNNVSPSGENSELSDSRKKLQNIDNLVKKLRRLNSTHDETSNDYIASLCENTNPDHRYISEILLASGLLLRELDTTFQLHQSGHPINPELFLVLEQTKASTLQSKGTPLKQTSLERSHRKLVFDAVNEVIVKKLALVGPSEPWLKCGKLAKASLSAQKLLKEVCFDIEMLQGKRLECCEEEEEDGLKGILWDDVMNGWEKWTEFNGEVSGVVLDVERSIFKDLVDEIVIGGATGKRKPVRRRQLFGK